MPNTKFDTKFDAKSFNPRAFKYAVDRIPRTRLNEMRKSRALAGNPDIRDVFSTQGGTSYARIAMRGLLDGDAVNYDGQTNITATSTKTFEQGVVVVGRAKAWTEKDFSFDITGGVDWMDNVAQQVSEYWQDIDQDTILAVLKGVFSMTGGQSAEFVAKHTYEVAGNLEATTMNSATVQACGDRKRRFSLVFMHSAPATNLENLNLLTALKYTDKEGVTRDLTLYTWNGKIVVVDDGMPATDGYFPARVGDEGALQVKASGATEGQIDQAKVKASGATEGQIDQAKVKPYFGKGIPVAGSYVVPGTQYVTYVLGEGAISSEDIGAKVPYEMARDPKTNGGEDTLYTRQRKVFAPFGISYEKNNQISLSPTDKELEDGANWCLVHSGESSEESRSYIAHKAIPIARILSRG